MGQGEVQRNANRNHRRPGQQCPLGAEPRPLSRNGSSGRFGRRGAAGSPSCGYCRRRIAQLRQPFIQALRALRLDHPQAPVHRFEERWRIARNSRLRQPRQRVHTRAQQLALAPRRLHRRLARDRPMAQGAQRVNIRPRALRPLAFILLRRRVAGRSDGRHALGLAPQGLPRRPEVQQHRRLVGAPHEDVGRLDVPVQEARRVNLAQPVRHRQKHPLQLRLGQGTVAIQQLVQRLAILVVHDDVGGAVGLEVVRHPHQVGVAEAGQRTRLIDETGQPPLEVLPVRGRLRMHRCALAHGELVGQVLLHRHPVS